MSPEHDELDDEYDADEAPRSIFSVMWFRVLLVIVGLGLVGVIGIPYVLDVGSAPPTTTASVTSPPVPDGAGARAVTPRAEPAKPLSPTPVPEPTAPAPVTPSPASTPAPGAVESPKRAATAKATERATASEPAKPAPPAKVAESTKPADEPRALAPRAERAAATRAASPDAKRGGSGDYFVQVGAFKDEATARRVAAGLRARNYPVAESVKRTAAAEPPPTSPSASIATSGDRYDVLVSGRAASEINTKLAAKGLASEPSAEGVRIRPSLPLRDAVALSKDLGSEGFKVQVRRGGGAGAAAAPTGRADGATVYRVRVGGYPDRTAAQSALRELRDNGYDGFIAKGRD